MPFPPYSVSQQAVLEEPLSVSNFSPSMPSTEDAKHRQELGKRGAVWGSLPSVPPRRVCRLVPSPQQRGWEVTFPRQRLGPSLCSSPLAPGRVVWALSGSVPEVPDSPTRRPLNAARPLLICLLDSPSIVQT